MATKVPSELIANNAVGITQLNVSDGSDGQVLTTDGLGTLSFSSVSGTTINNNADNRVITGSGTANTLNGESNFVFDGTNVGIGTSSPNAPLEVNGGTTMTGGWGRSLLLRHPFPMMVFQGEYSTDTYAGIGYDNTSGMQFMVNSPTIDLFANSQSAAMVIDNSKNVGIGTASPASAFGFSKTLEIQGGANAEVNISQTDNSKDWSLGITNGVNYQQTTSGQAYAWESGGSERMRIDSSGNLLINQTSSNLTYGKLQVSAGGETAGHGGIVGFFDMDSSVGSSNVIQVLWFGSDTDATGGQFIRFRDSNSVMGSVSAASGTTVAYNTSSDRRMKENIVDAASQLEVINDIQIREFDWKNNGHHEVGVIAQELNEVIPNVVQEGGDDVTEEPWGVDYGKLTPYLIKAVQEQQKQIEALQSEINLLKGE